MRRGRISESFGCRCFGGEGTRFEAWGGGFGTYDLRLAFEG